MGKHKWHSSGKMLEKSAFSLSFILQNAQNSVILQSILEIRYEFY